MTHDNRRAPGGRQHAQRPCFLFGARRPAQAKSTEASGKGCHIGATRPRLGGQQGGGHHGAQDGVTPELFAGEDRFCQDRLYYLSPFKFTRRCWLPSRSVFGKRTRASINRTSHHSRRQRIPNWFRSSSTTQAQEHLNLRRLFFPCTVHHQPKRQSTTTTLE